MRTLMLVAALAAVPAMAADDLNFLGLNDAMLKVAAGQFVPLQMADGAQQWRWVGKLIKDDTAELRYTDNIAQAMGKVLWCPRGWEEMKRTPASGMLIIEGKCK